MSNELKPVAYMIDEVWAVTEADFERASILKQHIKDDRAVPLYAIPEGYHIVAIDHEQEQRDNLERHNEKLRDNNHYQAGYLGLPLGSNLNEDQATDYHQGAKGRQRERE